MAGTTFAEAVEKKVEPPFEMLAADSANYYTHPTYKVKSLSEYVELVSRISLVLSRVDCGDTIIYRGLAREDFDLSPSLSRLSHRNNLEQNMINDFLTRRPDAFQGLNCFDTLAKMQHYGLPTRLLDFTINPLVALYFACEKLQTSNNGRIVCHCAFLQNDTAPLVSSISKAVFEKPYDSDYTIDQYLCDEPLTLKDYLHEVYFDKKLIVVRPKYWNQRIANQAGVFAVFPNNLIDLYYEALLHAEELGSRRAVQDYGMGRISKKILERVWSENLIAQLKRINSDVITDEYARMLLDDYSSEFGGYVPWEYFENRFGVTSELKPISNEMIRDGFCSIIVENKHKKRIINELSQVGISADYIYPELEYTAKEIVRQYK